MTIRFSRSRGFDRVEEHLAEAEALARRQYYRLHLRGEQVERAEHIQDGAIARVIYLRATAADPALVAAHRTAYGAVAFDIDTPQRSHDGLRTQARYQYDREGVQRRCSETSIDARGNLVREVLGTSAPETIIEYEHNENHVLLRSVHKLPDGTVTEIYDWLADQRLGMI
jgi:hypothetical protein